VLLGFVALQTLGVALIPVVAPYLQERLAINDAQIGLLISAFTLAVALAAMARYAMLACLALAGAAAAAGYIVLRRRTAS
jgi:hypothetical protein